MSSFPQREQSLNWAILFGCTKQCMRAAGQPRSSALWPFHPLQRKLCTVEINLSSQIVSPLHVTVTSPCVSCSNLKKQQRKLLLLRQDNSEDGGKKEQEQRGREQPSSPFPICQSSPSKTQDNFTEQPACQPGASPMLPFSLSSAPSRSVLLA